MFNFSDIQSVKLQGIPVKVFLFQFIARDKLNKLLEKALVVIHLNNVILTKKLNIFIYTSVKVQGMQEK